MIYYNIVICNSEIIQNVAYDNYDDLFSTVVMTSYFHKISFHYFEDYLMMKLTFG
jgi:hypothetical protein